MRILLIPLFFSAFSIAAQRIELGLSGGYGRSDIETPPITYFSLKNRNFDFAQVDIQGILSPENAPFEVDLGIAYAFRGNAVDNYQFLRIPVGINLKYESKFLFFVGVGLTISLPIRIDDNSEEIRNYSKVQAGWSTRLGMGFRLNDNYAVCISYNNCFDLSELYNRTIKGQTGASHLQYYGSDSYLSLSLRKTLKY